MCPNMIDSTGGLQRFSGIDVLKCVAAYMVVIIHFVNTAEGSDTEIFLSQVCNAQARAAIPVFFMITGFFYGSMIKRGGENFGINHYSNFFLCVLCRFAVLPL